MTPVSQLLDMIGLEGVSVVGVIALVSVLTWGSRAQRAGYVIGGGIRTAQRVAIAVLLLVLGGYASLNYARLQADGMTVLRKAPDVIEWVGQLVGML